MLNRPSSVERAIQGLRRKDRFRNWEWKSYSVKLAIPRDCEVLKMRSLGLSIEDEKVGEGGVGGEIEGGVVNGFRV
jgi:hypothetical protein